MIGAVVRQLPRNENKGFLCLYVSLACVSCMCVCVSMCVCVRVFACVVSGSVCGKVSKWQSCEFHRTHVMM
jgi:hypothetical protein